MKLLNIFGFYCSHMNCYIYICRFLFLNQGIVSTENLGKLRRLIEGRCSYTHTEIHGQMEDIPLGAGLSFRAGKAIYYQDHTCTHIGRATLSAGPEMLARPQSSHD